MTEERKQVSTDVTAHRLPSGEYRCKVEILVRSDGESHSQARRICAADLRCALDKIIESLLEAG